MVIYIALARDLRVGTTLCHKTNSATQISNKQDLKVDLVRHKGELFMYLLLTSEYNNAKHAHASRPEHNLTNLD